MVTQINVKLILQQLQPSGSGPFYCRHWITSVQLCYIENMVFSVQCGCVSTIEGFHKNRYLFSTVSQNSRLMASGQSDPVFT